MPDDPLDNLPANPLPAPAARRAKICCEFCECELTPTGEVMKFGDKARGYRDAGDTHERAMKSVQKELDTAKEELEKLRAEKAQRDGTARSSGSLQW